MSECQTGCGKFMSASQLRNDILKADAKYNLAPVPLEMIYAVGLRESEGAMFFHGAELQYRDNMKVFSHWSKMSPSECREKVRIKSGENIGRMAKFRYEPSWKRLIDGVIATDEQKKKWRQILFLSIGYFQKGQVFHLGAKPFEQWESAYEKFKGDPGEQVRVCANDLYILMQRSNGDARLALTRYNAGAGARTVSQYGREVFESYQKQLANPLKGGK